MRNTGRHPNRSSYSRLIGHRTAGCTVIEQLAVRSSNSRLYGRRIAGRDAKRMPNEASPPPRAGAGRRRKERPGDTAASFPFTFHIIPD
ncbi:MAG: hypothetical protein LBD91_01940 [Prevotellaceae bacterium]|jgi:hypothetical protein|nr:hypothetical protein [Prevotellaceae bacterium]